MFNASRSRNRKQNWPQSRESREIIGETETKKKDLRRDQSRGLESRLQALISSNCKCCEEILNFGFQNTETPQLLLPTPLTNQGLSCDGSYCCNKTLLQVAKWDFEVREKCHVLRSIKPDKVWNH